MQARTTVRLLSDGNIKFDGGVIFGTVPKALWGKRVLADSKNRIAMGLNCLLIGYEDKNILVDTGVGSKEMGGRRDIYGLKMSQLGKGLKEIGLSFKDIDAVILTHLHFDHSGGCTRMDRTGELVPVFSNATYYVQRSSWEESQHPGERLSSAYHSEDFHPIEKTGQLVLLDGDVELFPGIRCVRTHGHAQGHQVVLVRYGGELLAFLGDIVPTPHHLELGVVSAMDHSPEASLEVKRELLTRAKTEGWLLVFYHGAEVRAGYLEHCNSHVALRSIDL